MATTNAPDDGFRRWRRSRPFWGGLLLLIGVRRCDTLTGEPLRVSAKA